MKLLRNPGAGRGAIVALLVTMAGCDKAPIPAPSRVPDSLMIDAACAPVVHGCDLGVGSERTFSAFVVNGDGSSQPEAAQWASDDATVASVDATGVVRGLGRGSASISARVGSLTAKVPVQVVPARLGDWKGEFVVRRCIASGSFDPIEWCDQSYRAGVRDNFELLLEGDNGRFSGVVVLDRSGSGLSIDEHGSRDADGWFHLTARRANGMLGPYLEVIDPLTVRPQGNRLEGRFVLTTIRYGHPVVDGSVVVEADLQGVTSAER